MQHRICVLLFLLIGFSFVKMAPSPALLVECLSEDCDVDSGPVCAIDETGLPQTFENRCTARLAFCRFGSFYAEVKQGEC